MFKSEYMIQNFKYLEFHIFGFEPLHLRILKIVIQMMTSC